MTEEVKPDWIAFEPAKWIAGTAEMDAETEFVFFRLCIHAYNDGSPLVRGSIPRNAMRCKVPADRFADALALLVELEKITILDDGILVHSTEARLADSKTRITGRRRGAAIARRKKELIARGLKSSEISQIISEEFTDHQSDHQNSIQTRQDRTGQDRTGQDKTGGEGGDLFSDPDRDLGDPLEEMVVIWNEMAADQDLPKANGVGRRGPKLKRTLKDLGGIEGWKIAVGKVAESDFLRGRAGGKGWKAGIDFLLQPSSLQKLMEDQYQNRRGGSFVAQAIRAIK